jgi:MoxR-like ATPase
MLDETRAALAIAVQAGQPVLLWGAPGEGKTSLVGDVGASLGRPVEIVIGSLREASDFAGLPMRTDLGVSFAPPSWAVRCLSSPETVLFLDELTTAEVTVQAAMMRVIHERVCGDLVLPSSVSIVAAANPPDCAVGGSDLAAPLANRFLHLDFELTFVEWCDGMQTGWNLGQVPRVCPERQSYDALWRERVVSFIRRRPELLRQLPSRSDQQGLAWPSPRTWDAAARIAAAADTASATANVTLLLIAGLVGQAAASEFLQYVRSNDLQDPEALLQSPSLFDPTRRSDVVITALSGVSRALRARCTKERWDAAWLLVEATCAVGTVDAAAMLAMDLMGQRQDDWEVPTTVDYFNQLLLETPIS